jgi:serine/threonine protein kinase
MKSSDPYIGRVFGSYRINSLIACGSYGCVYLAQHVVLPRLAAIKVLHSSYLHSLQEKQRFSQEALILEKLKFRHILEIYDFSISNGIPFLITEYAPNGSLSDLLKRWHPHPLPIHRAIAILTEIGKALAYANQHNIVHHDLKPANILFNGRNEVLLADFGIAIVQSKTTLKRPSASLGTPAYMAPEQFKGKVGQRSDQYSLACITYELVTGRLPFIASNGSVLGIMHLQDIPIPPTQFNPLIPLHVEQAILKALEKSSSNRYTDISAFITALNRPNLQGRTRRISHNTEEQLLGSDSRRG